MNTSESKRLYECTEKLTPKGVSSPVRAFDPYPLFAKRGCGCTITDVDGNDYLDLCMAYGPLILGHSNRNVIRSVKKQLEKGSVYGMPSESESELLKNICSDVPCAEFARLTNSGTEATMHATRLARGFTKRNGIVKMNGGFHGSHDTLMVNKCDGSLSVKPFSKGIPQGGISNTYSVEYNDIDSISELLESNDDIAAVITEPVMGNNGVVSPKNNYLKKLRSLTEKYGCLLIFDEVITGYRLSRNSAQGLYGVKPDLCTMGKIIGGGFPAGAVAGRKDIMEMFAPAGDVYEAGTFSGNPVSATAGNETIRQLKKSRYKAMSQLTEKIVASLTDSLEDNNIVGCVQSAPSMFQIFFGKENVSNGSEAKTADMMMFNGLFRHMLKAGVYLPPSAMEVEFLSTSHDEIAMSRFVESFDDYLRGIEQ